MPGITSQKNKTRLAVGGKWISGCDQIKSIFINPPYEKKLVGKFADRFLYVMENQPSIEGIWLSNNFTETRVGERLLNNCKSVCFPTKRIRFLDHNLVPKKTPLQGQMILGFGNIDLGWFRDVFGYIGPCFSYMVYPDEI